MRAVILTTLFCLVAADATARCKFEKTINHVFPASAFESLQINALAGELLVSGGDGSEISFRGNACSETQEHLDQIFLDIDDKGSVLVLTVMIPRDQRGFDSLEALVDVEVTVPATLATELRDSSGDISVKNASISRIDDSSGNIRVIGGKTDMEVEDSSGDIDIRRHEGNVTLFDSSGEISVSEVKGLVRIPRDSSGNIEIDRVTGDVTIERDSSGNIEIDQVDLDVFIDSDGSGDIIIAEVKGSVTIGSDGSGRVDVRRIDGDFLLHAKGSGNVDVADVKGRASTPR